MRATNDQLLDGIEVTARGLAFVAANVNSTTRGSHAWGMGDSTAFLARAGDEVLVHGWDIASGLGIAFEPPPEVCAPIVRRRFPWITEDVDPWTTLLTADGRIGEEHWIPLEGPLDDWDGTPPTPHPPAIAWERDSTTARWLPRYP